jgi:hypothetical protein
MYEMQPEINVLSESVTEGFTWTADYPVVRFLSPAFLPASPLIRPFITGHKTDPGDDRLGQQLGRSGRRLFVFTLFPFFFEPHSPLSSTDTIIPGFSNCTSHNSTDQHPEIGFSTYPDDKPCDEMYVDVRDGVPPYTVSILVGTTGTYMNLTGQTSSPIKLKNTVAAGQSFTSSFPSFLCSSTPC